MNYVRVDELGKRQYALFDGEPLKEHDTKMLADAGFVDVTGLPIFAQLPGNGVPKSILGEEIPDKELGTYNETGGFYLLITHNGQCWLREQEPEKWFPTGRFARIPGTYKIEGVFDAHHVLARANDPAAKIYLKDF